VGIDRRPARTASSREVVTVHTLEVRTNDGFAYLSEIASGSNLTLGALV
jgi:hypothetical protein